MAIKRYLTANTFALAGTYPTGEQDAQAADFTATGANTLRSADAYPGAAMTFLDATTAATTSPQAGFFGMWAFEPLSGAQTVGGGTETLTVNVADMQASLAENFCINRAHAYVWRPSTGAKVGDLCNYSTSPTGSPAEATSAWTVQVTAFSVALSSVSAADGDVIIVELWSSITQDAASAWLARLYYGGTTENTTENDGVTNHAAFIELSQNLTLAAASAQVSAIAVEALEISSTTVSAQVSSIAVEPLVGSSVPVSAQVSAIMVEVLYQPVNLITGTFAATESGSDTFAAEGTVAWPEITGTFATTESGSDSFAADGQVYWLDARTTQLAAEVLSADTSPAVLTSTIMLEVLGKNVDNTKRPKVFVTT